MQVSQLKSLLNNFAQTLEESGARQVAKELNSVCEGLDPFAATSLTKFADFLVKAEEYSRTGLLSGKSTKKAQVVDAANVEAKAQEVKNLEERSIDDQVTYQMIDSELTKIGKALNKDEAIELANQLGLGSFKLKKDALGEIRQSIVDRKDSTTRVPI